MKAALVSLVRAGGSVNEDAAAMDEARGIFVVADGMGGAEAGEVASAGAADAAMREIAKYEGMAPPDGRAALGAAARAAHRRIRELALGSTGAAGMGSTIVAALLRRGPQGEGRLFVMNVGDSRAYVLRGASIILVSEDHSLVAGMRRSGAISVEEARRHELRHVLSRVLGSDEEPEPSIREIGLRAGDLVLLCTDGVTDALDDDEIVSCAVAAGRDPERLAAALARAGSGKDDATALVVPVGP